MFNKGSRLLAALLLVVTAGAMLTVSFDAEARRMGGGRSFGKQSSNIMKQRQAAKPPAAASSAQRSAAPAAGAAAAGAAAKSGMSRWLGPLAGIAAGLGIAALLSSMGLSGAFLEFMSSMLLIGLVVFAVIFLVRKLRGGMARPAMQQSGHGAHGASPMQRQGLAQQDRAATPPLAAVPAASSVAAVPAPPVDESWFIPGDFDTATFLGNAKAQFIKIQSVWDSGNLDELRDYMTDDLIAEVKPELMQRDAGNVTEVVLLNAELLGIETVSGGHLASVRYSGMLRESPNTEAFRFEEVWNLYKADGAGWLLAGIQQIPLDNAS
ncbi:Tim44 domain-containing protein [Pusillimonas sp. ANT_WB101]|uniref:Tim44 domain-containing protein n=1 Tax=Pusillimonas sp. ANT_WB101 TaxID=2597356 RepID=UPI0011EBD94D|nr:TIM44-like domain-containing protein [Pusillimonas sp. ANT_WB101]KAA0890688.1 Tim44 domain-containing protein [Pusillimonas sp. ANT_WB101]NYT75509.1 Tim44 domain-containing protein [Alcaligenaceae bacterium]